MLRSVSSAACRLAAARASSRTLRPAAAAAALRPRAPVASALPARAYGAGAPPSAEQIGNEVLAVLRCFDKIDPAKLTLEADFIKDLGLDSLDVVECVMAIEDEFTFELTHAQAEKITCAKHLVHHIMH